MKIHIREPYYGAASKFGWTKGDFGVGVVENRIVSAILSKEKLEIKVGKDTDEYVIGPQTFWDKAKGYNAQHTARDGSIIWLVPLSYLHRFKKDEKDT